MNKATADYLQQMAEFKAFSEQIFGKMSLSDFLELVAFLEERDIMRQFHDLHKKRSAEYIG